MNIKFEDRFIEVPGGAIFSRKWSCRGTLSPIILLHDSLGSVEIWRDFPESLCMASGRDVIAYDRLGYAKSSPRNDILPFDFIRQEADIFFPHIKESYGIKEFILFGHSTGGSMSAEIAAKYQKECIAVITEASQAFVEPITIEGVSAAKESFKNPAQFDKLVRYHGEKAKWVLDAWTETWLSPQFRDWNLDETLKKVTSPLLAIHGEYDEFGSAEFPRRFASLAGGSSEMILLEKTGHVQHRERKEEIIRIVLEFIEKHR